MTVNNLRKATKDDDVITLSKNLIKAWKKLLSGLCHVMKYSTLLFYHYYKLYTSKTHSFYLSEAPTSDSQSCSSLGRSSSLVSKDDENSQDGSKGSTGLLLTMDIISQYREGDTESGSSNAHTYPQVCRLWIS